MKSVKQHNRTLRKTIAVLALLFSFSVQFLSAQDEIDPAIVAKGKKIFNANCASCHKLEGALIGPALGDVTERRTNEWLKLWIKDNAALRASGDADAIAVFNEYNGSVMTAFPQLSDEDIDAILTYTANPNVGQEKKAEGTSVGNAESAAGGKGDPTWLKFLLGAIIVLALVVIGYMARNLREIRGEQKVSRLDEDIMSLWKGFKENTFLHVLLTIIFLLSAAYFGYKSLMGVGIDQGYEPIQPIAFSHKVHAGDNKIDCQYCHASAKHSKTSGIPSVNICMNCHKSITEYNGEPFGNHTQADLTAEIQKIYKAIGWDKEKMQYIEGYEQKPIKWVRVHNLPDFAYFNHSQHVTVGGVACQTCHGPVEEMDELYQFSPLSMGWCIDCHTETEVDLKGNEYYAKIHEELSKKYGVEKVTVAQMGGKECGKCHY